ncbi:MAG TPA: ribosome silencing factor [Verrucomicrobiae bacterium]|jgi:ribosome-associated protein|nr:ribosome silencing factor [Verrucomicrobiae bacterium]
MIQEIKRQVAEAVRAVESKKGENISILEMDKGSGPFTDYFVLATGTNPRQIQAIADEVQTRLVQAGMRPNSVEGYNQAEWVLVDYVDFVVHVFSERARKFYDLERLWKSARRRSLADLERKAAAKAAKKPAKKKAAASRVVKARAKVKTGAVKRSQAAGRVRSNRTSKTRTKPKKKNAKSRTRKRKAS